MRMDVVDDGVDDASDSVRHSRVLWTLALTLAGCTWFQPPLYEERYEIKHLTVILMDEKSIQGKWEELSRKPAVKIITIGDGPTVQVKTVRGFYDFSTNTLYCPKMNYEICGHELFHAIFGKFHPEQ